MKILLVTGKAASGDVKKLLAGLPVEADAHVCASNVAALLSPEAIEKELSGKDLSGYVLVLVPGSMRGDVSRLAEKLGVPFYKGPRHLSDLAAVLEEVAAGNVELSGSEPADELIRAKIVRGSRQMLAKVLRARTGLKIGRKNPVFLGGAVGRVVAEINDAPMLSKKELATRAKYYAASGADVIDIGMPSGGGNSKKVPELVDILRSAVDVPLSIDSFDLKEICSAADSGIDLVLSVDLGNLEVLESIDVPAVAVPRDGKGVLPEGWEERVGLMEKIIGKAGKKDVIADLVLSPVNLGLVESLTSYAVFRERNPETRMMIGAGNVTEMIDADSPGANALLAGMASELGIDLLFTTEASPKTAGAVKELSTAARMACVSKIMGRPPKDMGFDLLVLKDKRKSGDVCPDPGVPSVRAGKAGKEEMEDTHFSICVSDRIIVACFREGRRVLTITGVKAKDLCSEIMRRRLVNDMGHSAYLGRELCKAEIALSLGKGYVQDEALFKGV